MNNVFRLFTIASIISIILFSVNCSNPVSPKPVYGQPVNDIDGNVYQTVIIGTQTWMAANLRTTRFNDGTTIPSGGKWLNLSGPFYCWYNDDSTTWNGRGGLYNWCAVNAGKLAPEGWHVPTDSEWNTLVSYLGGKSVAGGKLKEAGSTHWGPHNTDATNETGFSALPGSFQGPNGTFGDIGMDINAYWWSASASDSTISWVRIIGDYFGNIDRQAIDKGYCCSIRCVKD